MLNYTLIFKLYIIRLKYNFLPDPPALKNTGNSKLNSLETKNKVIMPTIYKVGIKN